MCFRTRSCASFMQVCVVDGSLPTCLGASPTSLAIPVQGGRGRAARLQPRLTNRASFPLTHIHSTQDTLSKTHGSLIPFLHLRAYCSAVRCNTASDGSVGRTMHCTVIRPAVVKHYIYLASGTALKVAIWLRKLRINLMLSIDCYKYSFFSSNCEI